MDYLALATAIATAVFWYRGATFENIPALFWVGPSIAISAITIFAFNRGWIAVLLGQAALFVGITAYRVLRDGNRGDS